MLKSIALAVVLTTTAASATATTTCWPRSKVIDHLEEKYKETSVAIGLTNTGGLVEVMTSKNGKTWTIIVTLPDRTSCMVAAGINWRSKKPSPLDPEA